MFCALRRLLPQVASESAHFHASCGHSRHLHSCCAHTWRRKLARYDVRHSSKLPQIAPDSSPSCDAPQQKLSECSVASDLLCAAEGPSPTLPVDDTASSDVTRREDVTWSADVYGDAASRPWRPPDSANFPGGGGEVEQVFNVAPLVLRSSTLQQLVAAGVSVAKWDDRPEFVRMAASLDMARDVAPFVDWLLRELRFPAEHVASLISANPLLIQVDRQHLQARVDYLRWKRFPLADICHIVLKSPRWLQLSTRQIDTRLGFFSKRFLLKASEVRFLATKNARLITSNLQKLEINRFTIHEEFGFDETEMKLMLLDKPKVWLLARFSLQSRLDFLLDKMCVSRQCVVQEPAVLQCRVQRLRPRHLLLRSLNRSQYDPLKPGYVAPLRMAALTDQEFCQQLAHVPLVAYHEFLKTL